MGGRILKVGARASRLSRAQTEEALGVVRTVLPPDTRFAVSVLETPGDRDKLTPLTDPEVPDDFFTRDLDEGLIEGRFDLTVHSAKDLPARLADGLSVAAILPRLDPRDAIVLRPGLRRAADARTVGTSSERRMDAARVVCPAAEAKPLRGTIDERIAALDHGEFDAILVAACALMRLGLDARIAGYLPGDTTPLQGHLALVVRADADDLAAALQPLDFRREWIGDVAAPRPPRDVRPADSGTPATLFTGTHPEHFPDLEPILHWPMIRLEPRPLAERAARLDAAFDRCASVVFASAFAARTFVHALVCARDPRALRGKRLFAVGPATADAMERLGLRPDATAPAFGGIADLAPMVAGCSASPCFYPCSGASPAADRIRAMAERGVELVPALFYDTVEAAPGPLPDAPFDRVFFTSPSTVRAYFRAYPDERTAARRWLAIGAPTLAALESEGLKGEIRHEQD